MTPTKLDRAIAAACQDLAAVAPDIAKGKGKAYEAWVLLALAVRLKGRGASVSVVDAAGIPVNQLIIPKNPAPMPAANAGPTSPGHLLVNDGWARLEIHSGIQYRGNSQATHELDISVVLASEGRAFRESGGGPYTEAPLMALELKAYSDTGKLDQSIPRALLGTMLDIDPSSFLGPITLTFHGRQFSTELLSEPYFTGWPVSAIVTSTELYENSKKLLQGHGSFWHENLTPNNDQDLGQIADKILTLLL